MKKKAAVKKRKGSSKSPAAKKAKKAASKKKAPLPHYPPGFKGIDHVRALGDRVSELEKLLKTKEAALKRASAKRTKKAKGKKMGPKKKIGKAKRKVVPKKKKKTTKRKVPKRAAPKVRIRPIHEERTHKQRAVEEETDNGVGGKHTILSSVPLRGLSPEEKEKEDKLAYETAAAASRNIKDVLVNQVLELLKKSGVVDSSDTEFVVRVESENERILAQSNKSEVQSQVWNVAEERWPDVYKGLFTFKEGGGLWIDNVVIPLIQLTMWKTFFNNEEEKGKLIGESLTVD